MIRKIREINLPGTYVIRFIAMLSVIVAVAIFSAPLWAQSVPFEKETKDEPQAVLVVAQAQPEQEDLEEGDGVADEFIDLEDLETGEDFAGEESVRIADPLEPWNRVWYHFNDKLYFWMFKPMAQGYRAVVPEGFRSSFSNFYVNTTAPVRIFNSLFQLKFGYFFTELGRFLINTTIGFVGFRDCAKDCFGIKPHDEDFGQTLGHYGIGHGIYLVWPLLGPSSLRDTVGKGADSVLSFTGILSPVDLEVPVWAGLKTHELVNDTSFRIGDYEAVKKAAIDPYIAIRDGYAQRRKKAVQE